ncbi:MAG: hypothetical protein M1453_03240 [Acidobacteria bacterium]|nr:hypothetical protein [Acidobacteriota bacterium]MCL5286994.1 hypothetical protein [Acidobacteriota bacterium]
MNKNPKNFYWHATASSGGNLSLEVGVEELSSKSERVGAIADALKQATKFMEEKGYIPFGARLMSSRDIAEEYGKTRQYWEKLLNEGKILYKETSAGRITTNLWVKGYLGKKAEVDKYVKDVRTVLHRIKESKRRNGSVVCPVCEEDRFEFYVNTGSNTNGICRACGFHVHTSQ